MGEEKLLTVRDVSILLDVSEKEIMDLAENGTLPAYKVGGVYLRFKKDQISEYRKSTRGHTRKSNASQKHSPLDRISDFLYFNDFYILATVIIAVLLFIIFKGY
ncbi:MAG: helix-turn-helix domain-containing protein [Candidatus Omnitrophica bacterium]|nr:helix-turn-helix domain-containing protein [Candidatus Omnitrophota bacterium]